MPEWALRTFSPSWFGAVPQEALPLILRGDGTRCPSIYLAEGPGVWQEGTDPVEVKSRAAAKSRAGRVYNLWERVIRIGDAAEVYRLVDRIKSPRRHPDTVFTLVEFLEVVGESLGIQKSRDPMDPVEFHKYVLQLLRDWAQDAQSVADAYADKIIEELEKQDWSKLTEREIEAELGKLSLWVPPEAVTASTRMARGGRKLTWDIALATRAGVIRLNDLALETSFNLQDSGAIDRLSTWTYRQIPVSYVQMSTRLSKTIQRELIRGLQTGEHYRRITAEIAKKTPEIVTRQQMHFLNVTAQSALARARSQAQLLTYRDARVTVIRLAAVMDERTTPQCSFLNNQIIGVEPTLAYMERAVGRDEDPREAFPWIAARRDRTTGQQWLEFTQDGKTHTFAETDSKGTMKYREGWNLDKLVPYGVGMPPYHALCRSTTYMDIATL